MERFGAGGNIIHFKVVEEDIRTKSRACDELKPDVLIGVDCGIQIDDLSSEITWRGRSGVGGIETRANQMTDGVPYRASHHLCPYNDLITRVNGAVLMRPEVFHLCILIDEDRLRGHVGLIARCPAPVVASGVIVVEMQPLYASACHVEAGGRPGVKVLQIGQRSRDTGRCKRIRTGPWAGAIGSTISLQVDLIGGVGSQSAYGEWVGACRAEGSCALSKARWPPLVVDLTSAGKEIADVYRVGQCSEDQILRGNATRDGGIGNIVEEKACAECRRVVFEDNVPLSRSNVVQVEGVQRVGTSGRNGLQRDEARGVPGGSLGSNLNVQGSSCAGHPEFQLVLVAVQACQER